MEKDVRTKTAPRILSFLARNKPASKWEITKTLKKSYGNTHATIQQLLNRNLIKVGYIKPSAKNPKIEVEYYELTFKGLIFLLKEGIINSKEALGIREFNSIEIPMLSQFDSLVINIEKDFSKAFYKLVAWTDIEKTPENLWPFLTVTSAFYTLLSVFGKNPDSIEKYMKEKNIGYFENLEAALETFWPLIELMKGFMENSSRKEGKEEMSHE